MRHVSHCNGGKFSFLYRAEELSLSRANEFRDVFALHGERPIVLHSCLSARAYDETRVSRRHPWPAQQPSPPRASEKPIYRRGSNRPILLIVDDDVTTTRGFAKILELEGYCVFTAFDAETGLAVIERYGAGRHLLDLRMSPGRRRVAFLQRMRVTVVGHRWRSSPAITGWTTICSTDGVSWAEVRFKPLWLEDLLALVSSRSVLTESRHDHS